MAHGQRDPSIGDKVVIYRGGGEKRGVVTQLAFDRDGAICKACVVYENWLGWGCEYWAYARDLNYLEAAA